MWLILGFLGCRLQNAAISGGFPTCASRFAVGKQIRPGDPTLLFRTRSVHACSNTTDGASVLESAKQSSKTSGYASHACRNAQ
jgi:hypothetical protein